MNGIVTGRLLKAQVPMTYANPPIAFRDSGP